jgi:hypothetical protein
VPEGLLYRVVPVGTAWRGDLYITTSQRAFGSLQAASFPDNLRPGSWEAQVREAYYTAQNVRAERLVRYGKEQQDYPEMLRVARRIVREIIALNPQPPPEYYKNLGIICYRLRASEPDAEAEMIQSWQTYLRLGPRDDPEIPAMRQVLKRALARQ